MYDLVLDTYSVFGMLVCLIRDARVWIARYEPLLFIDQDTRTERNRDANHTFFIGISQIGNRDD